MRLKHIFKRRLFCN